MKKVALYLRSSKDRSDASIDAQRRALVEHCQANDWQVVREYSDTVFSGKTENRPGFQKLHAEMKHRTREWEAVLVLDTSRIARRVYIAEAFRHEAEKQGVEILYKNLPEIDPITQTIIRSVLQAMDEYHSLISKEKGLAGMRENIMKGFRAGGRAPRGYALEPIKTGTMREGAEVLKTRLVPNADAPLVTRYMKARALGRARQALLNEMELDWPSSSVIGMEWNALTYAGHTVWNQHAEQRKNGYKGGPRHRPRAEWIVKEDTHEALITTEEAEALLSQLEQSSHSKGRRSPARYLLTGLLADSNGQRYEGSYKANRGRKDYYYRWRPENREKRGAYYRCREIDSIVIEEVSRDFGSGEFAQALFDEVRKTSHQRDADPAQGIRSELVALSEKIDKFMAAAVELENPGPAYRQIDELEKKRKALKREKEKIEAEYNSQAILQQVSLEAIQDMLESFSKDFKQMEREELKDTLKSILDRVELEPNSVEIRLIYKFSIPLGGRVKDASPRGSDENPLPALGFVSREFLYRGAAGGLRLRAPH